MKCNAVARQRRQTVSAQAHVRHADVKQPQAAGRSQNGCTCRRHSWSTFCSRWPRYVAGRSAVLQGFLDRPRIYHNEWFFYRYESQARANLRHALAALQQGQLYA
jgi:hypothetical protein